MNTVKSPVTAIDLGCEVVLDDADLFFKKEWEGLVNTNEQITNEFTHTKPDPSPSISLR